MIARVFPTKTNMSPDDEHAYFGEPDLFTPEYDEVHICVVFSWDMAKAEHLAQCWKQYGKVKIGGPAFNSPSGDFVSGRYMKRGVTITSRGCPNKCWFCSVPKRENGIKELQIVDGNTVQDDNLLACSEKHIRDVFTMLRRQKERARLMGLEAKLLKRWHIDEILKSRIQDLWFAYDTKNDRDELFSAGKMLDNAGISREKRRCYLLCGYENDSFQKAEDRAKFCWDHNFFPFMQVYRDDKGYVNSEWRKFARQYQRPAITRSIFKTGKELWVNEGILNRT